MIIFWFVFAAAFISIMWLFFMSPFFKITKITLPENDIVPKNEINNLVANNAPLNLGENIFIFSKNKMKLSLVAAFPAITNISVKKELFHGLDINFEKRIPIGIWCQPTDTKPETGNCYYLDKEGIIFREAPTTEGSLILKIRDSEKKDIAPGNQVLNNNQLKFIIEFNDEIIEKNQFKIMEFSIKPSANFDLRATTDQGWSIYLDQNQNPALEASNLFTILNDAIKNKIKNLDYVDLRIPSRIFYKLK